MILLTRICIDNIIDPVTFKEAPFQTFHQSNYKKTAYLMYAAQRLLVKIKSFKPTALRNKILQGPDTLYGNLHNVAGLHGANARRGSGGNHIPG